MVPRSKSWIFPENYFKGSTRRGGDRIETCSQPQVCPSALVPGTVLLWEALGSCMHPGFAACPTRAFLTGSCAQPCLSTVPSSVFVPRVSCYSSSQGWRPGTGVVHFLALAQIPAQLLAKSSPCAVLWFGHLRSNTVTPPFEKCTGPIPGF